MTSLPEARQLVARMAHALTALRRLPPDAVLSLTSAYAAAFAAERKLGEADFLSVTTPLPALTREEEASRIDGSDLLPVSLPEGGAPAQFPQPLGWSHGASSSRCVASARGVAEASEAGTFSLESGLSSLRGSASHCSASTARAGSAPELSSASADCNVVDPRLPGEAGACSCSVMQDAYRAAAAALEET